jgi:hypothetical protein
VPVHLGRVETIVVYFPWGCAGLCFLRVLYDTWPILPLTRDAYLSGNDFSHTYSVQYDIETEPVEIVIEAYNEDDTYAHSPLVIIEMTDVKITDQMKMFRDLF